MVICLERDADLQYAQLMPLPLTVSCFSKIQIGFTFLVLAHPGSPGKRAVKRMCVCVCVCVCACVRVCVLPYAQLLLCESADTFVFDLLSLMFYTDFYSHCRLFSVLHRLVTEDEALDLERMHTVVHRHVLSAISNVCPTFVSYHLFNVYLIMFHC